jgi:exosortase A
MPSTESQRENTIDVTMMRQRWLVAGSCLAFLAVAMGFIFHAEVFGAIRVWQESTAYNHCFLIIPVSAYMIWDRRAILAGMTPQPCFRALALIVALSAAWIVAAKLSILELQQFIVIGIFEAATLCLLGIAIYRALLGPLLYLFFLVPSGDILIPRLQDFTARFVVAGLHLFHIPVFSDGVVIQIPAGTFVIAEACAGLRFLTASLAFGVLFALLFYRSRWRRLFFIGLSIIVPIIANGLRALGILLLAHLTGSAQAATADHIIYGWIFFSIVTLLLILLGMSFTDGRMGSPSSTLSTPRPPERSQPRRLVLATSACLVAVATGPAYAAYLSHRPSPSSLAGASPPPVSSPWHAGTGRTGDWHPIVTDPDRVFMQDFSDGQSRVTRYIALYKSGGFHDNLIRDPNRIFDEHQWQRTGEQYVHIAVDGQPATIDATRIAQGAHTLLIWHFYIVGGRIVASPLEAKLLQLRALFTPSRSPSAFVALATDVADPAQPPVRALTDFLNAMAPMKEYLQKLN